MTGSDFDDLGDEGARTTDGQAPGDEASAPAAEAEPAADDASGGRPEEDVIELDEAAQRKLELDELRDRMARQQAEFENIRKRLTREQGERLERANERLVAELLPVLDAFDNALSHEPGEHLAALFGSLWGVLEREGLERVGAEGDVFDPTLHEAVQHLEPSEESPDVAVVAQVMRRGYRYKGRLVRPAMVAVAGG